LKRIRNLADVEEGLEALVRLDPRLAAIRAASGEVPLRLTQPGFASLASIIVSQQVSTASARAIYGRLVGLADPLTHTTLLAADDSLFREAGLSGAKHRTLLALSRAVAEGLDLNGLCDLEAEEAVRRLSGVKGIGPWTAEVYLLFAAGHPDVFPGGDVALQTSVGHGLGLETRPDRRQLVKLAESWAPWRGVAARLFWAYYRTIRGRDAAPSPVEGG
jgi:DNA-3-methyladenine glycosylase II